MWISILMQSAFLEDIHGQMNWFFFLWTLFVVKPQMSPLVFHDIMKDPCTFSIVRVKIEWVAKHVLVCHHSLPLGVLATDICCTTYDLILPLRKEFEAQPDSVAHSVNLVAWMWGTNHIEFHEMWSSTPTSWSVHTLSDVFDILITSRSHHVNYLLLL